MAGWGDPILLPQPGGGGGTTIPGNSYLPDPTFDIYGKITNLAANTPTTILSYVVPATPITHLLMVEYGGENTATFTLEFNNVEIAMGITYFGGNLGGFWDYRNPSGGGKELMTLGVLRVRVEHFRPLNGNFFTRMCFIAIN